MVNSENTDFFGEGDLVCAGCDRFVEEIDSKGLCSSCSSMNEQAVEIW